MNIEKEYKWADKEIGELCTVTSGGSFPTEHQHRDMSGLSVIKVGDLSSESLYISDSEFELDEETLDKVGNRVFEEGTVVLPKNGESIKTANVNILDEDCTADNNVLILQVESEEIISEWIAYFLQQYDLKRIAPGTTAPTISNSVFKKVKIPVPPVEEQERIVSLLSDVDEYIEKTSERVHALEQQKQAVLNRCFEATDDILSPEFHLSNYELVELSDIASIHGGYSEDQIDDGEYPVTRIETIADESINMNKFGLVNEFNEDYRVQSGDIIMSNINSKKHLGKTAFAQKDYNELMHGMNLVWIRCNDDSVLSEYIYYVLSSMTYRNIIRRFAQKAVNQASINQNKLGKIRITIIDLEKQRSLVNTLSPIDSAIESSKFALESMRELKKGLLQELFSG